MSRIEVARLAGQKKSLRDSQQETKRVKGLREDFQDEIERVWRRMRKHLKFIDESGAHLGLTRLYGRAAPGQRVVEATPGSTGAHYTFVASLSLTGIGAPAIFEGAMTGDMFEFYVTEMLGPTLKRNDIVVMDNLAAHKQARIRQAIEAHGAQVVFLPPYSPDFNPIELCWSKVKAGLRRAKARTYNALTKALGDALRTVTCQDALAWFAHCGYAVS